MKMLNYANGSFAGAVVVLACTVSLGMAQTDPNEGVSKRLLEIRAGGRGGTEAPSVLEEKCLKLVSDHNNPSDKGRIYATITLVYAERVPGSLPEDERRIRLTKTAQYANEALGFPLDVPVACRIYGVLGDAITISALDDPKSNWAEARRRAIAPCLKGLRLALDSNAPKERPASPPMIVVPHVLSPQETPGIREARRRYEEQLAARKQYERLEALYIQRRALVQRCGDLYSREPDNVEEFQNLAGTILAGHDDVVKELTDLVRTRIAERKQLFQRSSPTK